MKPAELRVSAVQVKDVLGITEAAIKPGKVTILSGRNGSTKSSLLSALQTALGGGDLGQIARIDPDGEPTEPEVVVILERGGLEAYRIKKTAGKNVKVLGRVGDSAAFEDVGKPQAWLSSLFDPTGSNPVRFLSAPDKQRALLVLEALALTLDRPALLHEMGIEEKDLPPIPRGLPNALEEIGLIRDGVFSQRTGVNRDQKAAAQAADQVRRAMPAVMPEDPGGEAQSEAELAVLTLAQEIEREEAAADATEAAALKEAIHKQEVVAQTIKAAFKDWKADRQAAHEAKAAEIRAAAERRIEELRLEMETEIDAKRTSGETDLDGLDSMLEASREAIRETREAARGGTAGKRERLQADRERLATLRAQREGAAKASALDEQAKKFEAQSAELEEKSERLTAALAALDAFRRRMADNIPIPGLEIEGQTIRVDGIPFDQLNTARRVEVAVKVACLRAKGAPLPVVFVDGAEALDTEHFAHLVEALKKEDVQAWICRVEDGPFRVTTEAGAGGA